MARTLKGSNNGTPQKDLSTTLGILGDLEEVARFGSFTQRVHVGIWYILRPQRGSHIPTLRPKYIPYTYMDPLG